MSAPAGRLSSRQRAGSLLPLSAWHAALLLGAVASHSSIAASAPSPLPPEVGYDHGETRTARIGGMAGALRATSNTDSALFINPANMAAVRAYHAGILGEIWPEARRQTYGAAVVDSVVSSSGMAGGLGVTYTLQDSGGVARKAWDVRFGLAYPLGDSFFIGAAGRYLSLKENGFPSGTTELRPSTASTGLDDEAIVADITFDAALTLRPAPSLSLSLVGTNLTNPGHGFLPLGFGGGIGFGTKEFTLEADAVGDFTTYDEATLRAMAGGELLLGAHVPLRLGYRYDQGPKSHSISGGIGYADPGYSVDLAVERNVAGPASTAIFLTLKAHIENTGLTPQPMTY